MSIAKFEDVLVLQEKFEKIGISEEVFRKEASFALQIWNDKKNSYLRSASKETFLNALLNVAQVGLTLNPASKEAYLVPRRNGNEIQCCLDPSYIGLVKLLTEHGGVASIQTNIVWDGDDIDIDLSCEKPIKKHVPYFLRNKQKGDIVMVYSIAKLKNGNTQFEYMSRSEIEDIRDTSEAWKAYKSGKTKSCIWNDYRGEMFRKTVIKRIAKYCPRTNTIDKVDKAIELSNHEFMCQDWQIYKIETLLNSSNLIDSQKTEIERDMNSLNFHNANELIVFLENNQVDPIESGNSYSAADIQAKLHEKINDPKA